VHVAKTIMQTSEDKANLASEVLSVVAGHAAAHAGIDQS